MTRLYGRGRRGQRFYSSVPHNPGLNSTVIRTVSVGGVVRHRMLDGGVRGATFQTFVSDVLIPALRLGHVVVIDNPSEHKTKAVRAATCPRSLPD